MMRMVYTFGFFVQHVSNIKETAVKHINYAQQFLGKIFSHTYSMLLFAAVLLMPNLVAAQCNELICNQGIEVKLDSDCIGEANEYYIIANYWSCIGPATMEYFDELGVPIPNNLLNAAHIGQDINVHVTHEWSGHDCWATINVIDKKKPTIEIDHVSVNCTEDTDVASVGEPTVFDNCSNNITVTHADSLINFGCGYTGFAGYFDPSNWTECLVNNGDGGVDVTGAPGQILVEGADNSPLSTAPKYITKYKIVIPTEGYVSFDWSSFGGSLFNSHGFYLTINNWCVQITNDTVQSGSYTTVLLQPGDVLSFEQVSDGDANAVHTLVSNFHFHTLAWKVIHRTWSATDEWGNTRQFTQVITKERAALSQVMFPPDRDGVASPMLACGAMADLSLTGQPFIDKDGDPNTTADQYALDNGECAFNVVHEDQHIATCEGSELVLRKWTIVDDCTSQILEHTQIIKLFDITPPVVNCPPAQTIGTESLGCFSTITLPQADAFDDCSSTVTITPNWNFGSGFGPFDDVPTGTFSVTYEATDDCGNTNTCSTFITIQDEVSPTVICDGQTVAALDGDGNGMVYANVVDDGSYDWCCVESYLIKEENAPDSEYAPTLPIDCSAFGSTLMITLKVTDCAGNSNTCNVDVIVQDDHDPVILPPADLTVDCTTDLSDLSVFGDATVFDNCSYTLGATYEEDFVGCGEGAIVRIWIATDPSGNVTTGEQKITLDNLQPWNLGGNNITWPSDYYTVGCGLSLEPFDLPMPYPGPVLAGQNGCESVAVSHTDEYFYIAEPSCFSLFRHWKIVDWCQYVPNSNNGIGVWEYTQLIEVQDNEPPVFINPPDEIVVQGSSGCSGEIDLPQPEIDDCSNHINFTVSGDLGTGFIHNDVPAGTYQMTYFVEDGCGNTATHTFTVSIGDDEAPTAYCLNGLTVNLGSNAQATVNAASLDAGSSDNCSTNLQFSFSQNGNEPTMEVTCANEGQNNINLYIFDDGGNMATCPTFLMVMDNQNACFVPDIIIAGLVHDPQGSMIAETEVELTGAPSTPYMTDANGDYIFENLVSGNNYVVTPSKTTNYLNGVTAYDLSKINAHILGVVPFQETWQYIAADANGSDHITVSDIVAIQNLILHNVTMFPNGVPSWHYVPDDHVFANPFNPWPFPANISMNNLQGDYLTADFMGIKVGDVTGNADPTMLTGGMEDRSSETTFVKTEDLTLQAGELVEISFEMEEVNAYQFTLVFDPSKMVFIEKTNGNVAIGTAYEERGQLTAIWYGKGEKDFTLQFEIIENTLLSDVLKITSEKTPAIAWDKTETALDLDLEFNSQQSTTSNQQLTLFQNQPNPFSIETTIPFYLPASSEVQFDFFDAKGKLLFSKKGFYEMGRQEMVLRKEELGVCGLVFYEMRTEEGAKVGKLLVQ